MSRVRCSQRADFLQYGWVDTTPIRWLRCVDASSCQHFSGFQHQFRLVVRSILSRPFLLAGFQPQSWPIHSSCLAWRCSIHLEHSFKKKDTKAPTPSSLPLPPSLPPHSPLHLLSIPPLHHLRQTHTHTSSQPTFFFTLTARHVWMHETWTSFCFSPKKNMHVRRKADWSTHWAIHHVLRPESWLKEMALHSVLCGPKWSCWNFLVDDAKKSILGTKKLTEAMKPQQSGCLQAISSGLQLPPVSSHEGMTFNYRSLSTQYSSPSEGLLNHTSHAKKKNSQREDSSRHVSLRDGAERRWTATGNTPWAPTSRKMGHILKWRRSKLMMLNFLVDDTKTPIPDISLDSDWDVSEWRSCSCRWIRTFWWRESVKQTSNANEGTTCTTLREGAELRVIADGALSSQRHRQRAATTSRQIQKAT